MGGVSSTANVSGKEIEKFSLKTSRLTNQDLKNSDVYSLKLSSGGNVAQLVHGTENLSSSQIVKRSRKSIIIKSSRKTVSLASESDCIENIINKEPLNQQENETNIFLHESRKCTPQKCTGNAAYDNDKLSGWGERMQNVLEQLKRNSRQL